MRRYWYVVFRSSPGEIHHCVIDKSPADWLIEKMKDAKPESRWFYGTEPIIVNQFEITAEEFQRLETLQ